MYKDNLVLKTERLVLRTFSEGDIPRVFELLHGNEELVEYLPFDTPNEIGDTQAFYDFVSQDPTEQVMAITKDGVVMGLSAIRMIVPNHKASIGYWLHQDYHGNGYATELSRALVDWALTDGGLKMIYGNTFGPNKASQNVLKKCGFTYVGDVPFGQMKNGRYYSQTLWYKIKDA